MKKHLNKLKLTNKTHTKGEIEMNDIGKKTMGVYLPVTIKEKNLLLRKDEPIIVDTRPVYFSKEHAQVMAYHLGSDGRVLEMEPGGIEKRCFSSETPFVLGVYSGTVRPGEIEMVYPSKQPPMKY